jgi:hypothetical protein
MTGGTERDRRRTPPVTGGASGLVFKRQAGAGGGGQAPAAGRAGPAPAAAPAFSLTATRVAFNTAGAPDPANCAVVAPTMPALGASLGGRALNAMEMVFRINGTIPRGTEFEITRTVTDVSWERDAAGNWRRILVTPAGTGDDRTDNDECHPPDARRIFVLDEPGFGGLDARGLDIGGGVHVAADATAFAIKLNFFEWVIARNRSLGIDWTVISQPVFHRWHSIHSVADTGGGAWSLANTPGGDANEIALGHVNLAGNTP